MNEDISRMSREVVHKSRKAQKRTFEPRSLAEQNYRGCFCSESPKI